MLKSVCLAFCFGTAAALCGLADASSTAAEEAKTTIWLGGSTKISEGAALIERGRISRGVAVTREAMQEELSIMDLAAAYNNLCAADLALKLYQQAIDRCTLALRMRPALWQAFNNRANAHFGLADWDRAIADYNRAVAIRPDKDILAYNLFLALERKRKGATPAVIERDS